MSNSKPLLTGSCACKAIRYSSDVLPDDSTNCYCETCRRLSGSSCLTFIELPTEAVTWLSKPRELASSKIATRGFCDKCGTPLFMKYVFEDSIGLTLGSVDEESVAEDQRGCLKPKAHIFLREKPAWCEIGDGDGARRWQGVREDFQQKMDQANAKASGSP